VAQRSDKRLLTIRGVLGPLRRRTGRPGLPCRCRLLVHL